MLVYRKQRRHLHRNKQQQLRRRRTQLANQPEEKAYREGRPSDRLTRCRPPPVEPVLPVAPTAANVLGMDAGDMSEDDRKGTIVYDNACNVVIFIQNREPSFFKNYSLQCDNFHHEHGGSGKGHRNCGPGTNMINARLHTSGTYSGNVIEQKNSRVRLLERILPAEANPSVASNADCRACNAGCVVRA